MIRSLLLHSFSLLYFVPVWGQQSADKSAKTPTLQLDQGLNNYRTTDFILKLVNASQTAGGLYPAGDPEFDFTPGDSLEARSRNGMYHLGDINIRLRPVGQDSWSSYSTAVSRKPVHMLKGGKSTLAAADLAPTLPAGIPLQVQRFWENVNGRLVLRFELRNKSAQLVEIGSLGIPMIFDNLIGRRSLKQAHLQNVLYDPYIGMDAGYLQVTRLNGRAPTLLVLPYGKTPFEAYNPLLNDPTPRGITFEGFYEWMALSKAYADNEWKNAEPWNTPTSVILKPGEMRSYGVQLILSGTPRDIETTLHKNNRPVATGIPGYVLPQDVNGRLYLQYKSNVKELKVEPEGSLHIMKTASPNKSLQAYTIHGKNFGRARLTIVYEDGTRQTIQYKIIKPEAEAISSFGNFLYAKQWYDSGNDRFGRSPAFITYDYEKQQQVTQDNRAWIAGLSDEGGAGGWLGAAMKQLVLPDKAEIEKLERFVDETLFGRIQVSEGEEKYGVRKSLFYYEPDSMPPGTYNPEINFKTWSAWPLKEANALVRSYNYPHVAAAYWVLYRLSRNHVGLVTNHTWNWYLENAYHTIMGLMKHAPYYTQFGLMEGSVFYFILKDLKAEGLTEMAAKLEEVMKKRAIHWNTLEFPFGSEMPWDSTGQEEVYIWCLFFGYHEKADVTLNAILGYMPAIPSWAYNGNARRYWDFLYGGKTQRIERMIHHYGSELNAIPVLTAYRNNPDDLYLLRVGYGGVLGGISNMTEDGFAPCAFHAFPSTLKNDGINGDYGSGFYGYAINTATYIVNDKKFGWQAFGGNLFDKGNWVNVDITTAARQQLFIAPERLWITFSAGQVQSVAYNKVSQEVKLKLSPGGQYTPQARFSIEQTEADSAGNYVAKNIQRAGNGVYTALLSNGLTEIIIQKNKE